jgi:hypothetical protein
MPWLMRCFKARGLIETEGYQLPDQLPQITRGKILVPYVPYIRTVFAALNCRGAIPAESNSPNLLTESVERAVALQAQQSGCRRLSTERSGAEFGSRG